MVANLAGRAVKLYGLHLLLSLAGLAVFACGAVALDDVDLLQRHGRDLFLDDPAAALIGLVTLGHQLGYFNVLPMYVLLVSMAPAMLWLASFGRGAMLAASFGLYGRARALPWDIPSWPMRGEWLFAPLAWQFLLAVGVAVGLGLRARPFPRRRSLALLSAAVVGLGFVAATDGLSVWPGLNDATHAWADVDKTMLGTGRLVHFLALAYLVSWLGLDPAMRRMPWYGPLCLLGRRGLWAFCCSSILAAVGQVAVEWLGHSPATDLAVVGGGLAILYGTTLALERIRRPHRPLSLPAVS